VLSDFEKHVLSITRGFGSTVQQAKVIDEEERILYTLFAILTKEGELDLETGIGYKRG
jgi:hypothetical protein